MKSPYQLKAKPPPRFEIAKDEQPVVPPKPASIPKQYTDSGYHGTTEDEMEVDIPTQEIPQEDRKLDTKANEREHTTVAMTITSPSDGRRTTGGSFHSAKEEQTARLAAALTRVSPAKEVSPAKSPEPQLLAVEVEDPMSPTVEMEVDQQERPTVLDIENEFSDIGSPSDGSTPDRPIVRKSSLTFASLPAREPLTTKSIGNRISRTSQVDQVKLNRNSHISHIDRMTGSTRLTQVQPENVDLGKATIDQIMSENEEEQHSASHDESEAERATRLHNKSSTQRLHEKIDMLGKTQAPRQSKSIPSLAAITAKHAQGSVDQPQRARPSSKPSIPLAATEDDDSWIQPLGVTPPQQRPGLTKSYTTDVMEQIPERDTMGDLNYHIPAPEQWYDRSPDDAPAKLSPPKPGHMKSASTVTLVSPSKASTEYLGHSKNISVSNPSNPTYESTTPYGSPRRMMEGPLSASKSKLQSIMKTAKGLFTSSAGVSAAAKMETLSPNAMRTVTKTMPGLYPNLSGMLEDKPLPMPPSPTREPRRTRSSTDREKEERRKEHERQKVDSQLQKAREKERQKAAGFKLAQERVATGKQVEEVQQPRRSPRRAADDPPAVQMPPPSNLSQQSSLKSNDSRRPIRPTKETLHKPKPPAVAIKVGTMSQRMLPSSSTATNSTHDLHASTSKPTLTKKASTTSVGTSASGSSFKSSVTSNGKPKALVLAAQKREQEEKEAQRKAEQKREMERKRAAQQEEARRLEQKQRVEADRLARERAAAEAAKRDAQKQAVEKRRLDAARKAEQQRVQSVASDDSQPARPLSRLGGQPMPRSMVNHPLPNPAKPPKRAMEEESVARPQAPKYGAASQQADAKRRRTEDENVFDAQPVRPTMAPPIRQSNIKPKTGTMPHGYTHAPAPPPMSQMAPQLYGSSQQSSSAYHPQTYHGQQNRPAHPMEMARYTNQKIVFADAPNPPSHYSQHGNPFKTPVAQQKHVSAQQQRSIQMVKSSPAYPNGENISLPEIPTDSEDSDSDASPGFNVPSWATPNALQQALIDQDFNGLDPDHVFGPMAPPKMEEIFSKGTHKDRLKKLKVRSSSARWIENGDVLTKDEVEKDKIAREKIRGEGGWRMGI